jgi:hypothetical protein
MHNSLGAGSLTRSVVGKCVDEIRVLSSELAKGRFLCEQGKMFVKEDVHKDNVCRCEFCKGRMESRSRSRV